MGDITPDTPPQSVLNAVANNESEIRVLVTGYGPFHIRYPVNSSWSIVSTLPDHLPATATCPRIKLIIPPEPITVSYAGVLEWEAKWMDLESYDMVLHVGLAAGRKFFTLERQSMREPYWQKEDVTGCIFSRESTELGWPAAQFPPILKPTIDVHDVYARWRNHVRDDLDVRPSDDPGNYLCGFIYYCSMAWYWKRQAKERPVMFLHVPHLPTEQSVQGGREVAVGLIRALVESREAKGAFDPLKGDVSIAAQLPSLSKDMDEMSKEPGTAPKEAVLDSEMEWTFKR